MPSGAEIQQHPSVREVFTELETAGVKAELTLKVSRQSCLPQQKHPWPLN